MAGLTTAAYLARAGLKVQVFEQHTLPGGYISSFVREGFTFPAGPTSLTSNGITFPILKDLGLDAKRRFVRVGHQISWGEVDIPLQNPQQTCRALETCFPAEKRGLERYFRWVEVGGNGFREMVESGLMFGKDAFKTMLGVWARHPRFPWAAWVAHGQTNRSLHERFFKDPTLQKYLNELAYPVMPGQNTLGMWISYFYDTWVPVGGMQALANIFVRFIHDHGGEVHLGQRIRRVRVEEGAARGVELENGAFIPARMAARLPPVEVIKSGALERRNGTRTRLGLMTSLPLLAACFVLVRHPRTTWEWTVAGLIAGLIALVLAGPHVVSLLGRPLLRWSSSRGATLFLAADSVVKFPARTSLTVVALGGSLSLVVALAGTIQSLERDIVAWMNDVFAFDLSLQVNELSASPYATGRMPGSFIDVVRRDPQCGEAYGVRATFLEYAGDDVLLIAYDVEPFQRGRVQRGKSRDPAGDLAAAAAMRAGKIAVSTNFAVIHGLDIGDRIELATPAGRRAFEIAHVQIDHSWFRGVLFMDLTLYRELWNDDTLTYIDIRLAPAADLEAYRAELTQRWNASHGVFVNRTQDLIDYGVRIMREWFRLANVQLLLAVIIGGVGVANTLLISVITQSRQIALLRAIGASAGHIRRMLATEAALVGLAGGVCGCVLGLITARWLILPMMIKASGIAPPFVVPVGAMAAAMAAALAISLGASVLPLRAVRRIDIVQGIGYE
ncbi:MAG: FAD-dependent oxidoreductase [Phycisphaerae bacterium]|nr:FAD-dependent oxidoreductase [Phycisphaerae bacterium]